jgi:hypothetical protein
MSPRYVARWFRTHWAIYDSQGAGWPVFLGRLSVPQSFPDEAAAQAWADQNLNGVRS